MPLSHLAVIRHRGLVVAFVTALALALAVAAVMVTVPAASSAPTVVASAPQPVEVASAASAAAATALAGVRRSQTVVVFGDSISARYNDELYHPEEAWWSILGRELGVRMRVRAERGGGFVNPGLVGCKGHTFGQQLAAPLVPEVVAGAGAVVIEGGRTDTQTCRPGGGYDLIPNRQVRRAVEAFMAEVRRLRGPDACTIVVVPWGTAGLMTNRDRITNLVQEAAARNGFTFVETRGVLTDENTIEDRVHPNRAGNEALTRTILEQGGVGGCFA